jgi:hypothetical protein
MENYELENKLDIYRQACRRGTDWLLKWMNTDGALGPVQDRLFYYRAPWSFALMGERSAANRVLDWIKGRMFSSSGAFEGFSPRGAFETQYGSYPVACLIIGAILMQRFEIVYPGTRNLRTWQDEESGGFYDNLEDATADGKQVLFPTAQGGMTLLMAGQVQAAKKAGSWLKRLWDLQPDVQHKLFHVFTPAKGLFMDFAPEHEALYVTQKSEPWQYHYNGGIAAAFLAKLYLATGESEWLDSARQYQEFSMTTDECQFQSMQTCKSGWGSGVLYVATKEERYRNWTARLGDWFVEHQHEDGHWENTKFWVPDPTDADNIEITIEFVMHLSNIVANLSI